LSQSDGTLWLPEHVTGFVLVYNGTDKQAAVILYSLCTQITIKQHRQLTFVIFHHL